MHSLQKDYEKLNLSRKLHEDMARLVTTDCFIAIEDDTLPPKNAVVRLLELLRGIPEIGFVGTVCAYRSPHVHKMGINAIKELTFGVVEGKKQVIKKLCFHPSAIGVLDVDAAGWACFAAKTKTFLDAFKKADEEKYFPTYIGNDMLFTHLIKKLGYKVLVDFDLWCDHMQELPDGIYFYNKKDAIQDSYIWSDREKIYKYKAL